MTSKKGSIKNSPLKVENYLNLMIINKLWIFSQYVLQLKWQIFQQRSPLTKQKYVQ